MLPDAPAKPRLGGCDTRTALSSCSLRVSLPFSLGILLLLVPLRLTLPGWCAAISDCVLGPVNLQHSGTRISHVLEQFGLLFFVELGDVKIQLNSSINFQVLDLISHC